MHLPIIGDSPLLLTKYYSSDKSRRVRWAELVARMGERRDVYRVLVGKPERKRPRVEPGVNVRILKWICKECDDGHGLD